MEVGRVISTDLRPPVSPVSVRIGGVPAEVTYAGRGCCRWTLGRRRGSGRVRCGGSPVSSLRAPATASDAGHLARGCKAEECKVNERLGAFVRREGEPADGASEVIMPPVSSWIPHRQGRGAAIVRA